jgi:hypothetical protein
LRTASARAARAVFLLQQVAEVKALACELPITHGLPLSRFSRTELHRLVVERGLLRNSHSGSRRPRSSSTWPSRQPSANGASRSGTTSKRQDSPSNARSSQAEYRLLPLLLPADHDSRRRRRMSRVPWNFGGGPVAE